MTINEASAYEHRAWQTMIEQEQHRRESPTRRVVTFIESKGKQVSERLHKIPATDAVMQFGDETIIKALDGAFKAVFLPAVRSVSLEGRRRKLHKLHPHLADGAPLTELDLKDLDKGRPTLTIPFVGVLESATASVAITGTTVSTTVSGGATVGVTLAAVAGDAAASLALLGRAVAEVAVHYGYDPREPEEELFLMGVLNYSMATNSASKAAALAGISRLSQQMMRRATWGALGREPLVRLLQKVFQTLGLRLTHTRLAQVVPIAGGVVAAGLSFSMLRGAIDDATRLYRGRYLTEKYNLTWDAWLNEPAPPEAEEPEQVVDESVTQMDSALDDLAEEPRSSVNEPSAST